MRIALFSGNYNYIREGANQALNRLAAYLEDRGHQVRAYSPVTDTPAFEPSGTLVPVPSIALPVRSEFRLALGLPAATRDDLARFAPDIVHVSTPDILNSRALSHARRRGIPVVASLHTRFETYLDHYGLGWARPLVEAHLRRFYRRCSHVLVPTRELAREMARMRGDRQVSLWSRGVDRALFRPERRDMAWRRAQGIGDGEMVVLFFGRLVIEKGVDDYVETIARLLARGLPIRPLIVGAGPAEERFRSLAGALFTGHLDGEALARAVASADVMLNPSTTEAFGNVVLEAMASGLPVVSADAPSAAMLIDQGRSGLLCSPRDRSVYAAAVSALAEDAGLRRRIGAHYGWDAASAAVLEAYEAVLSAAHTRRAFSRDAPKPPAPGHRSPSRSVR